MIGQMISNALRLLAGAAIGATVGFASLGVDPLL